MDTIIYSSAKSLAQSIRSKEISSEEVVETYLERIEEVNPELNAIVQLQANEAREQAKKADAALARGDIKGPLHGVPFTVKDNAEIKGIICTSGTKGRSSFVPAQDATIVTRMKESGGILLGKTNLPELALALESDNLVYGHTSNPYDLSRTSGGSSGGEAAIIAAGGSPLGLGNDAGGSIRLPSHFCGIAGIKPTVGRVPLTGHFPAPFGHITQLWQAGPMARFVEDLILTLPIIAGVDWRDPGIVPMPLGDPDKVEINKLRAAVYTDNGIIPPTSEIAKVVMKTAEVLSDAGMEVIEAIPEDIEQSFWFENAIFEADGGYWIEKSLEDAGTTEIHPFTEGILEDCNLKAGSSADFSELLIQLDRFRSKMLSFMENYDVIICPVCAYPAMPHGTTFENFSAFSYTMTYNLTGWPGAVVRAGTSPEGLPIGVQVVARPWREDVALAVAQYIEKVMGGWQPPQL
ncbi:amidase [Methanococcoides methylutens]|uniref:Amidase n=1 Tax=Methanococcoides methylutens MM1 TaxID=1434104 RepID=A0A0E3WZH4_METMT|nr:amidase [Methanococcoides methylutens]AKB85075.1 Amidase [Methanococcoides methylutens MM1]